MMKICLFFLLSFLPVFALSQTPKEDYSGVKNPGLYTFLTETYKPVSDLKNLPADTEKKLEDYEKKIPEQMWLDWLGGNAHFNNFKMVMGGISPKSYYIYYRSSKSPVIDHLGVFSKDKGRFFVSYYSQLPADIKHPSLMFLRNLVLGYYQGEQKIKKVAAEWSGNDKTGWINQKKSIKICISSDLKSVIATNLKGKPLWTCALIGHMERIGMWKRDDASSPEKLELYPKEIDGFCFIKENIISVYYAGRCFGSINLVNGLFTDGGCD
jgi:hypothetical protein